MKVSIIVPVYNAQESLRRCIDSVLGQEFQDFELLLVHDPYVQALSFQVIHGFP